MVTILHFYKTNNSTNDTYLSYGKAGEGIKKSGHYTYLLELSDKWFYCTCTHTLGRYIITHIRAICIPMPDSALMHARTHIPGIRQKSGT